MDRSEIIITIPIPDFPVLRVKPRALRRVVMISLLPVLVALFVPVFPIAILVWWYSVLVGLCTSFIRAWNL